MKRRWLALVLAAGKGTRMQSDLAKVLHRIGGQTLLGHVLDTAARLPIEKTVVVVGHQAEDVKTAHADYPVAYALQQPQLGTGHAVMMAAGELRRAASELGDGPIGLLVLYGDVPLLRATTLRELIERHELDAAGVTVLTARVPEPKGYGRILRDAAGGFRRIVEDRDLAPEERSIDEINSGIYTYELAPLLEALTELRADNAQAEYYLTDTLEILARRGHRVGIYCLNDAAEIAGINTVAQLEEAEGVLAARHRSGDPDGCDVCHLLRSRDDLVLERHGRLALTLAPHPWNSGELWIVPDRHYSAYESLTAAEAEQMLALAARAERWLETAFAPQGFNSGYVSGRPGHHLTYQVIPRWAGDANFMPLVAGVNLLPESLQGTRARLWEHRPR
ncbi:MAG: NTP transferase domain-containing protein [Candidatus Eisenbacteria bacterium]|nr:NTP transferase domain-containing protein [Candidatus Eisenbacteria bacterium]